MNKAAQEQEAGFLGAKPPGNPDIIFSTEEVSRLTEEEARKQKEEYSTQKAVEPLFRWVGCGHLVAQKPPEPRFIFKDILMAGIVGAIFATGGTGKTFLGLQLAASIATGVSLSPFVPVLPKRVLYLCGEDSGAIIHQRVFSIFDHMPGLKDRKADLLQNMQAESMVGQDRFLAELGDHGNPVKTETYQRLEKTVETMRGLEVLILDPLSRFYGLSENLNEHATYFVSILEVLAEKYGLTILFTHHTSKEQKGRSDGGRGASALRDGIRFAINMNVISEDEAKESGVNQNDFVELGTTKSNYSRALPGRSVFERSEGGVLVPVNLYKRKLDTQAEILTDLIRAANEPISVRGICKANEKKKRRTEAEQEIIDSMKEAGVKSYQKQMQAIINRALTSGLLIEKENGMGKKVLVSK